ncbi:MAG: DUF1799 domain-containing protein [Acetobacteraceae bacterium]|nr:DUF1799 domain-containing protein [Acetobacteraceae bacterium]
MDLRSQAEGLGLSAEQFAALMRRGAPDAETVEVWPENWSAVRVFVAMDTQWRRAGMTGIPCGLDYAAIPPVAGMLGVAADADLLARLQVLEAEALTAMAEHRT